jgi:hypothetical protein
MMTRTVTGRIPCLKDLEQQFEWCHPLLSVLVLSGERQRDDFRRRTSRFIYVLQSPKGDN